MFGNTKYVWLGVCVVTRAVLDYMG